MLSQCLKKIGSVDNICFEKGFPKFQFSLSTIVAHLVRTLTLLMVLHHFSVPLQPVFPLLDMRLQELLGLP